MSGETCARPDLLLTAGARFRDHGGAVDDASEVDGGAVDELEALLVPDQVEAAGPGVDRVRRTGDGVAEGLGVVAVDLEAWARGFEAADS